MASEFNSRQEEPEEASLEYADALVGLVRWDALGDQLSVKRYDLDVPRIAVTQGYPGESDTLVFSPGEARWLAAALDRAVAQGDD